MKSFNSLLKERILNINSHLCVGLDIYPEGLAASNQTLSSLKSHTLKVIDATQSLAVAYKPNLAFFERWGSAGFKWLEETMEYIAGDTIVIGDAKRGDIGHTAKHYARGLFDHFKFDAVTLNPYMGRDAIDPFLSNPRKGVFILCRTSNPSAQDLQDKKIGEKYFFEEVAQLAVNLNQQDNVGLVVGATVPEEMRRIRNIAPGIPFLIPGIGAQGGNLEQSYRSGNTNGIALINISRGISYAGDMSESAIRAAAQEYVDKMRVLDAAK